MMKYLSVFALYVRMTFWKLLAVLLAMCAGQWVYFRMRLADAIAYYNRPLSADEINYAGQSLRFFERLEDLLSAPILAIIAGVALVLVVVILCLAGCGFGAKVGYTVGRLRITERETFLLQGVYNTLVFVLFWAVELLLFIVLCTMYVNAAPADAVSGQSIVLACYRSDVLHGLLPLSDILTWVTNAVSLLTLAAAAALFPFGKRRGKFSVDVIWASLLPFLFFSREQGGGIGVTVLWTASLIIIPHCIFTVLDGGAAEGEGRSE